jgi:hypothetical protein
MDTDSMAQKWDRKMRPSPAAAWQTRLRMAKTPGNSKRPVEQYDHKGKQRPNNPPVRLVDERGIEIKYNLTGE